MSEQEPTYQEKLLILLAEELYAIRFLLTYPERSKRSPMQEEGLSIMERDLEQFRKDLDLD
jgi:hypothetical protein